jgi:hypothetical protein
MREDGAIIITDAKGEHHTATRQCAHCGNHFVSVRGSGIVRGFCTLCNHVTCGSKECLAHFPFEKKIDLIESGKIPLIKL